MATINMLEAFETTPKPLDMVLPGFVKGTVGILTSAGGIGKSILAMEACMGIVDAKANESLLKLPIDTHGVAVILNAEDQEDVIKSRLHAMGIHLDLDTRKRLNENFIIESKYGSGCDIMDAECQKQIIELFKLRNVRLGVLDTLSRWHNLDENSNADMGRLMAVLDRIAKVTGTSILIVHHVSKGMAKDRRQDEQQSARGASLLVDNARWQAFMSGMSTDEAKSLGVADADRKFHVRFGISKQNNGTPFDDIWLKKHEGGVQLPAVFKVNEPSGIKSSLVKGKYND